jgi:hypothetical protein
VAPCTPSSSRFADRWAAVDLREGPSGQHKKARPLPPTASPLPCAAEASRAASPAWRPEGLRPCAREAAPPFFISYAKASRACNGLIAKNPGGNFSRRPFYCLSARVEGAKCPHLYGAALVRRLCPNCGNELKPGSVDCGACKLPAKNVPCPICKTDIQKVMPKAPKSD